MKQTIRLAVVVGLWGAMSHQVCAQTEPRMDTDPPTELAEPDSLEVIKGFGLAKITEPGGKTHQVYVPAHSVGFVGMLPFYRHQEDIRLLGEPWSISVDKVQIMRLHGTYYEHMVVRGKRKHLLAARVVNGPVELFNYTEFTQVIPGGLVGAALAAAIAGGTGGSGIADRRWFVRRSGELVQVQRSSFVEQMSDYFKDDPETVAALTQQRMHYPDMFAIVEDYNQRKIAASGTNPK
jgi:hypothetical protein